MQGGMHHQSTLREKFKSSICCFMGTAHESLDHGDLCNYDKLNINTSRTPKSSASPTTPSSSASWFKKPWTAAGEHVTAELLPRVRGHSQRSRLRRHNNNNNNHHHHGHRQTQSADFSYDASSYALNFENEDSGEFPLRNFSARLPVSPRIPSVPLKYPDELAVSTAAPKEIVGGVAN
ncbi:uncharacterized protein LOC130936836 [Arachis stenosperma]|uniref:uncharacterized protein LOC130936836 n=1 Tax=Arachis stenosperma TaxID=217475 RepID=UPI0025ACF1B3|nr:uncharacterized protein LOC130936836 [Arachis stenosperma]